MIKQLLITLFLFFSANSFAQAVTLKYDSSIEITRLNKEDIIEVIPRSSVVTIYDDNIEISLYKHENIMKGKIVDFQETETELIFDLKIHYVNGKTLDIYYLMSIDIDTQEAVLIVSDDLQVVLFPNKN